MNKEEEENWKRYVMGENKMTKSEKVFGTIVLIPYILFLILVIVKVLGGEI